MNISQTGIDLIKSFESYMRALPNGDCVAYRCVVGRRNNQPIYDGKWTIGWGCTKGITEGTVWTKQQAEDGLRQELAATEACINRVVTVDINQNQFDACCSLSYNIGEGGFSKSSVLKLINAGHFDAAADAFNLWVNSAGVQRVPGLVRRRAQEAALFRTPIEPEPMPQVIEPPPATAVHEQADGLLSQASTLYSTHGYLLRTTGLSVPPGLLAIWNWIASPMHAALLLCGAALATIVVLEILRFNQRRSIVG